ncbi:MAG: N-acetyltransferase [Burkholderiales bacterium]|nr:MAG: N-acetyltransferase [Burkholderiales bacterium]
MSAVLVKPARVLGRQIVLRDATVHDAEFIVGLRTDPIKGQYLSQTSSDVQAQREWLRSYAGDDSQVYFIIEDRDGQRHGTVRLYDVQGDSFSWGSWILADDRPSGFAVESALMVYHFALGLGFVASHFSVRVGNESVWKFHERFGAVRTGQQGDDYFYSISRAAIEASFDKYRKYLPDGVTVIPR